MSTIYIKCGGGGLPPQVITDMNAVLNKKLETATTYPTTTWAGIIEDMIPLPEKTASGTIATFPDGADLVPLKSCEVTVTPSQSGTGDPSPTNPRPLNSFSSLTVEHTGKNFFDPSDYLSYKQTDGSYLGLGSDFNSIYFYIPQKLVGVQVTFSASIKIPEGSTITNPRVSARINGTNTNGNAVNSNDYTLSSITFTPTSTSDRLRITYGSNGSQPVQFKELLLEVGATATAFEEYHTPDPHTLALGSTVYGLTGDCVSGEFEETYKTETFTGSDITSVGENGGHKYAQIVASEFSTGRNVDCLCDRYKPQTAAADKVITWVSASQKVVRIYDDTFTDLATAQASLNANPASYCYPLATPTALTTDPVEVESFKGVNNIWCTQDNSSVAVEYRADIELSLQ